jgi:hypothetical protein
MKLKPFLASLSFLIWISGFPIAIYLNDGKFEYYFGYLAASFIVGCTVGVYKIVDD